MVELNTIRQGNKEALLNFCKRLDTQLHVVMTELIAEVIVPYQHLVQLQDAAEMVTRISAKYEVLANIADEVT
jgi:hypothetical protein